MKRALVQGRLPFGGGKQADESDAGESAKKRPAPAAPPSSSSSSAATAPPPTRPGAPNAFALLMSSKAREGPRREILELTVDDAGVWRWRWAADTTKAAASSASSADGGTPPIKVSLKYPGLPQAAEATLRPPLPALPEGHTPPPGCRPDTACGLSPSQLKSALQKAVRRRLAPAAVAIAAEMWRRDPADLVRRLIVVAVEDATLHPALPALAWAMMATQGGRYRPPERLGAMVMSVVADLCACQWKDDLRTSGGSGGDSQASSSEDEGGGSSGGGGSSAPHRRPVVDADGVVIVDDSDDDGGGSGGGGGGGGSSASSSSARSRPRPTTAEALSPHALDAVSPPAAAALLRALVARAVYGGMQGDVRMLLRAAHVWKARFTGPDGAAWLAAVYRVHGYEPPTQGGACDGAYVPRRALPDGTRLDVAAVPRLTPATIPLAGIDFHCSGIQEALFAAHPAAVRAFAQEATGAPAAALTEDAVEAAVHSAMWSYRSGLNARRPVWDPDAVLALGRQQQRGGGGGGGGASSSSAAAAPRSAAAGGVIPTSPPPLPAPAPHDAAGRAWETHLARLVDALAAGILARRFTGGGGGGGVRG